MSSSSGSSSGSSDNEASGRARAASGSSSRSRSRSVSSASSKSRSPALSRRSSSSGSSSPKFVSATSSDNSASKKSEASSTTSSKGRRRVKAKDRKVSNKMAEKLKKSDESDDEEVSSGEDRKKPRGRQVRAASGKKPSPVKGRRGGKKDTSSEEGEIASDDKEFDDGLDEDLIGGDEDRERLEKMTEREREEELFKRAENRENLKKRFEIKKKLKQQQKHKEEKKQVSDESEEGQRSDSDSDDDARKSPRKRGSSSPSDSDGGKNHDVGYGTIHDAKERSQDRRKNLDAMKKYSALSELKAKRQERERRDQERAQKRELNKSRDDDSDEDERSGDRRKKRRSRSRSSSSSSPPAHRRPQRSSSSSSASSRSRSRSSSASDTERFKKSSSKQIQKYVEIMADLEPIRLSRSKLEKFVHLPFFKRLVTGCFVKIGIGANNGRSVYRLVEVCDVLETAKVYNLGSAKTNIGLRLRFGRQERVFRPEYASNSQTTQQEFENWKTTCLEAEMQLPTLEFVKNKSAEIKEAINYEFTSEDIDKIVAQKERFHKHPVNYAMHKARLMKERDAALTNGDEARAQEFEVKLGELEERAEELDKKRTATISSVSLINDRNRKANVSKAEVAIMREIAHKKLHGQESNPFVRRPCNPRIVTKKETEDDSAPPKLQVPQDSLALKQLQPTDDLLKRKMDQGSEEESAAKKSKDGGPKHDLFEAHNFDIEIDVDTSFLSPAASKTVFQPAVVPPKNTVLGGSGIKASKRSLNLDDYKKKRGLI